jgi:cyclophilin family peptidyl-prolyl cis-trans isomerase
MLGPAPFLNGKYTAFGQVTKGMDVVDKIRVGDRITSVKVVP